MKIAVFDFDGTLTPNEKPIFEILEKSGMEGGVTNPKFLEQVQKLITQEKVEFYEAFIRTILKIVSDAGFELTNENIGLGAKDRIYNPGVMEFLRALKNSGVKSYILSSGAKAYLEQTEIAPFFTEIYASTLTYDKSGKVNGIESVMTPERKTETLRKLARGVNGDEKNCREIVYFGDGPTDMDVMKFVKTHGGKNIMIDSGNPTEEVMKSAEESLVDLVAPADFSKNSEISNFLNL